MDRRFGASDMAGRVVFWPATSERSYENRMKQFFRENLKWVVVLLLVTAFVLPPEVMADQHVVTPADLHRQLVAAAQQRERNIEKLDAAFSSAAGQKALTAAHIDAAQVRTAVSQLSDSELAELAARADKAQQDFAAGSLTNQQITYILIALATAVIVIILIKA